MGKAWQKLFSPVKFSFFFLFYWNQMMQWNTSCELLLCWQLYSIYSPTTAVHGFHGTTCMQAKLNCLLLIHTISWKKVDKCIIIFLDQVCKIYWNVHFPFYQRNLYSYFLSYFITTYAHIPLPHSCKNCANMQYWFVVCYAIDPLTTA